MRPRDGCPESEIADVEGRLGIRLSRSLRDYYLVAGRERRLNQARNRFLPPDGWFVDRGRLAFLEENQCVVYWGVRAVREQAVDPMVYRGVNAEPIAWHREHDRCSTFLVMMLHWHGTNGRALCHTGTAPMPERAATKLDRGWEFAGEVNQLRAYHRPGRMVCFVPWSEPFEGTEDPPP